MSGPNYQEMLDRGEMPTFEGSDPAPSSLAAEFDRSALDRLWRAWDDATNRWCDPRIDDDLDERRRRRPVVIEAAKEFRDALVAMVPPGHRLVFDDFECWHNGGNLQSQRIRSAKGSPA